MKVKLFLISFLVISLAGGCAAPPKKEPEKLPSPIAAPSAPLPRETLKELVVPQGEEAKKIPEKLYSLSARDANIQEVLLAFSKESERNIIIDPELSGKVTVDLKQVTLKEALEAILSPVGWTYRLDDKFIKISRLQMETRLFTLNYTATKRSGKREVFASTRGGSQPVDVSGQTTATLSTSATARSGYSDLISVDEMDLWKEIQKGLETIVFGSAEVKEDAAEPGKASWTKVDRQGKKLIVNKSSGVIWVTDYPAQLHKVAYFLEAVEGSSQRQVTIQVKIMEVTLADEYKAGINWKVIQGLPRSTNLAWGLTDQAGTTGFPGGAAGYTTGAGASTIPTPGTFKINPFGGIFALGAAGAEVLLSDILQAISEQGELKILSSPTISTLNNQKAIIRVGNQDVFFITGAVATQTTVTQTIQPMTIDIGIILDVTPQISSDGSIIMNIHPSITEKAGEKPSPDGKSTFPLLNVRETDTTVKVRNNETIIIAGLMQEKKEQTLIGVPGLQSIPLLGWLFRYKAEKKSNTELVIMITPTLQAGKRVEEGLPK